MTATYTRAKVIEAMGQDWLTAREVCCRITPDPDIEDVHYVRRILYTMSYDGRVESRQSARYVRSKTEWRVVPGVFVAKESLETNGGHEGVVRRCVPTYWITQEAVLAAMPDGWVSTRDLTEAVVHGKEDRRTAVRGVLNALRIKGLVEQRRAAHGTGVEWRRTCRQRFASWSSSPASGPSAWL